ncbi:hypothetical protein GCM10007301_08160 [Azorhizobium oxalatiphilum]|uniref:Uncharacterized protein n=1 Tax=Azorhizobium oxalatiphilum TaxID=980631 RepID=A0A917F6G0_9HYPH|nr:hypothetical protein GCM10007301_08160 [Azorhizobium oxalatiphilum]
MGVPMMPSPMKPTFIGVLPVDVWWRRVCPAARMVKGRVRPPVFAPGGPGARPALIARQSKLWDVFRLGRRGGFTGQKI